jgi:hypothetical protein
MSCATTFVSVFVLSVEVVLGTGDAEFEEVLGVTGVCVLTGGDTTCSGWLAGGSTVGLDPPMFSDMVGGGGGASASAGRSIGSRPGGGGAFCWGGLKFRPGTNSDAPALRRLMTIKECVDR